MSALPYLVAAAGLAVLSFAWWRARRGASPLGPVVAGDLPETRRTTAFAVTTWLLAQVFVAMLFPPDTSKYLVLLANKVLQAIVALACIRVVLAGPAPALGAGRQFAVGAGAGLVAFSLSGITTIALRAGYEAFGVEVPVQAAADLVGNAGGLALLAVIVAAVVLAPFAEEVIFRGLLLPALARTMAVSRANLVQAAIFGLIHFLFAPAQWPLAIPLAMIGWLAGWLYVRTRSLRAAVALHATYNALQVAFILLS